GGSGRSRAVRQWGWVQSTDAAGARWGLPAVLIRDGTMDREQLKIRVREALQAVTNPRTGEDLWDGGHVRELEVDGDGLVRFQFILGQEDPGTLVREARAAVEGVQGVGKVKI